MAGVFVSAVLVAILPAGPYWWMSAANATPFEIVASGQLQIQLGDDADTNDLEGAMISIVYGADTTDTATSMGTLSDRTYSDFDVFSMTVEITGRPNAAPDITSPIMTNDPIVSNWFPGTTNNDNISFDSRSFDEASLDTIIDISVLNIDFGSQTFLSGTGHVNDLSFFSSLGPTLTAGGELPEVRVGLFSNERYDIGNLSVTLVPEPSSMALAIVGFLALGCFGRRVLRGVAATCRVK